MKRLGLAAMDKANRKQTTFPGHWLKIAKSKLNRDFLVYSKQAAWAFDITYIQTKASWLKFPHF